MKCKEDGNCRQCTMSARKSPEVQLDLLPSSDCGDELSFPERGNAEADCAIGASAGSNQSPSRSDRAKASPVLAKTNACIKDALAGQDTNANCSVDTREPPIPPSSGLVPRKRGRPRGSRNKRPQGQLKPENVPGLAVNEAKASNATADSGARFISDKDVAHRYGLARSTIWRWLKTNPHFPRPVYFSNGTTRWRVADLEAYDRALGSYYPTKNRNDVSPADLAGQPRAKPSQQASDGGGHRQRRKR